MYLSCYRLNENPFQISTDPRFLWLGPKHEEGLATLRYGVLDRKGFLLLTGDVGTGKTTLVNALLQMLGENVLVAVIRDPNLEPLDFFHYISHVFSMGREFDRKSSFLVYFEQFLNEAHAAGKTVLLIIDEAQRISQELLEEVRLLSNIERHDCKLINIFFVGQIEFNDILLRPENRAIRQRITVNYTIPALTQSETASYIRHRMEVAGAKDPASPARKTESVEIFTREAVREIFAFSGGYPRLINIICDRCLLTGFVDDAAVITPEIVRECAAELKIPESEPFKRVHQPFAPATEPTSLPAEANGPAVGPDPGSDGEEHQTAARGTGPTTPGQQRQPLKRKRFFVWSMLLLTVLFVVIAAGYSTLSKNDNQALLSNLIMQYAETEQQSTYDSGTGQAGDREPPGQAPPLRETEDTPSPSGIKDNTPAAGLEPAAEQAPASTDRDKRERSQQAPQMEEPALPPNKVGTTTQAGAGDREEQPAAMFENEKRIIPFPSDSNYPPGSSLHELNRLVENLLRHPDLKIQVTGYSDSLGNEQYNVRLSEFRANTVKSYLVGKGLPESRITAAGMGARNPIASNDTPAGRIANRRVEIEVIFPVEE